MALISGKLLASMVLTAILLRSVRASTVTSTDYYSRNYSSDDSTATAHAYGDDDQLEFLMDSEINHRVLQQIGKYNTGPTNNANKPSACGQARRYVPCTNPDKNKGGTPDTPGTYKRK